MVYIIDITYSVYLLFWVDVRGDGGSDQWSGLGRGR